jgi:hypothetical protein
VIALRLSILCIGFAARVGSFCVSVVLRAGFCPGVTFLPPKPGRACMDVIVRAGLRVVMALPASSRLVKKRPFLVRQTLRVHRISLPATAHHPFGSQIFFASCMVAANLPFFFPHCPFSMDATLPPAQQ